MTTVVDLPERKSLKGYVATEVRAELSRCRITVARLPHLIGKSQSYWSRRVNGVTALDLEDLEQLATLLHCSIAQFFPPQLLAAPGPEGPDGVGPVGLEPTTYGLQGRGLAFGTLIQFPGARHVENDLRKSA